MISLYFRPQKDSIPIKWVISTIGFVWLCALGMPEPPFLQDEEVSPTNPFLEEEEGGRRDTRPLERALDMLMITTSRRCPRQSLIFPYHCYVHAYVHILHKHLHWVSSHSSADLFNITNMRGKVAKFCIFKTVYRLGEDIIGTFTFSEGDIPCLQVQIT